MTLAEHDAVLKAEGRYEEIKELHRRQQEERERLWAEWSRAEQPLVEALKAIGLDVNSAWGLLETPKPYPEAVPILLEHFQRPYPDAVREGIARALGMPAAKVAWSKILSLYRSEREERAKDGLAVAIAAIADKDLIEDVIALARDRQIGPSRVLLMRKLSRSRNPKALETLIELKHDPDLHKEIAIILRQKRIEN